MSANDIAEFDATGMLSVYSVVCVRASHAFIAHLTGALAILHVGITLLVSTQGLRGPQIAAGKCGYPRFLLCGWI